MMWTSDLGGGRVSRSGGTTARCGSRIVCLVDGDVLTLALSGGLDMRAAEALCDEVLLQFQSGNRLLRLDLAGVTSCDDRSLYTILGLRRALHLARGRLSLAVVSEPVEQAIARNRLERLRL